VGPKTNQSKNLPWRLLLLLGLCLLCTFLRLQSLNQPNFSDQTVYSYFGHALLHGQPLYTELVDNKPPAVFLTHALGELVFGYRENTVYYLGLIFVLLASVFLFLFLEEALGLAWAGLGTLFWVVLSNSLVMTGNMPNIELYQNTFLIIGLWGLAGAMRGERSRLWVTGCAWALASYYKQNFLFIFPALAAWWWWPGRSRRPDSVRDWLRLLAPSLILWIASLLYFAAVGRYTDFKAIMFDAAQGYVGSLWGNEWQFLTSFRLLFLPHMRDMWPLLGMMWAWFALAAWRPAARREMFVAAAFAGTLFMLGNNPGNRYYQLLMPYLAIFPVFFLNSLWQLWQARETVKKTVIAAAGAAVVGFLIYYQLPYFTETPEAVADLEVGASCRVDRTLRKMLGRLPPPDETIYQWGMQTALVFYSQRWSASGVIFHHIFFYAPGEIRQRYFYRLVKRMHDKRPAFLIYTAWVGRLEDDPLLGIFKNNYRFFGLYDKYVIFERRDRPPLTPEMQKVLLEQVGGGYSWKHPRLVLASEITASRYLGPSPFQRELFQPRPGDRDAELIREGNGYFAAKRYGEAKAAWDKALALHPDSPAALANLGIWNEMAGWYYTSLGNLQAVIDQHRLERPWLDYYREIQYRLAESAENIVK